MSLKENDAEIEVLVLGMPRTGTSSLRTALGQLGYKNVYHMTTILFQHPEHAKSWERLLEKKYDNHEAILREDFDPILRGFDAVTDFPPAAFATDLIAAYPNAKVILSVRDPAAWTRSINDTIISTVRHSRAPQAVQAISTTFAAMFSMIIKLCDLTFPPEFPVDGERVIIRHNEQVRRCMASRSQSFLEFRIEEGWEPLCAFLEKEVPDGPIPRDNDAAAFGELMKRMMRVYWWPVAKRALIVGSGAVAAYYAWTLYQG